MRTKVLANGCTLTTPDREDSLFQGFTWAPYSPLYMQSKPYTVLHFSICNCSLLEYIGVEWCTRIPDNEKVVYMKKVFDTLAGVGNDKAAREAFQTLEEIFWWHEMHYRCVKLAFLESDDSDFSDIPHDKKHPYYPTQRLHDVVGEEIRHELLDFIRERFWMLPLQIPKEVQETLSRSGQDAGRTSTLALLETRKEMIRACVKWWNGTPGDANDEMVFSMLCAMANPHHGGCPTPKECPHWVKELRDVVQQELRTVLTEHTYYEQLRRRSEMNWKYWMTRDKRPVECETVLNVLAKTRAALGGYKGALLDINARQEIEEMEDLLKNTKKFS